MKVGCKLLALFGAVILSSPAAAQGAGSVEVGAFGRYTIFDHSLAPNQDLGYGGRLGIFVHPRFELEGDISRTNAGFTHGPGDVTYVPIHARLIYNQPLNETWALLVGAGYVRNKYTKDFSGHEDGAATLVGARAMLTDWLALRLDVATDYIGSPINKADNNWNTGLEAGLSVFFFNRKSQPEPQPVAQTPPPLPAPQPADADRDGVPDSADRCSATAAGESVDGSGCARSQLDADNDGVLNSVDKCPSTPSGESVDGSGCAPSQRDSDKDGATDDKDRCPDTPVGTRVDANGCPVIFEDAKTAVVLDGVNFELGKASLLPEARGVLDQVAASLVANSDVHVEVAGYTDSTGPNSVNVKLSQARAGAVRAYLIERGVAAGQLEAKGYGGANPVASNATAQGRAQNRRVELHKIN